MPPKADPKGKAKAKKDPKEAKEKKEDGDDIARVEEPDRKEFDAKKAEIQGKIEENRKQLTKLSDEIGQKSHGKDAFQEKKQKLLNALIKEGSAIAELKDAKDKIRESLNQSNSEARAARQDLTKMKRQMAFTSTREIDDKIKELEYRQSTESMTLHEEKKILEEIKQLKKNKPLVTQLHKKQNQVDSITQVDNSETMKDKLDTIKQEMDAHFTRKKDLSAQLDKLNAERENQTGGVKDLYDKRTELNEQNKKYRDELSALENDFYQKNQLFKAYQRELREQRQQKMQAERDEWNKQRDMERRHKMVAKLDDMPHQHEINLIEQTIKFCKNFQPKEDAAKEEKKETAYDNPDTHLVLKNKGDRDEEFYYAPTKTKGAKKGKKGESGGTKSIKHNAETFKLFHTLKLDCPVTTDDIPKTLEKLEEEMEKYKQKIQKWEEEKEERKRKILDGEEEEDDQGEGEAKGEEADKEA